MAEVSSLLNHPGWKALEEHIEAKIEATVKGLARDLLYGAEFNQRQVDRTRGQVNALRAVMKAPQAANAAYARAKRKEV